MQPPRQSVSEVISRFQRSSSRAISGTNHSEGLDRYFGKRSYEEVHEEEGKSAPLREVTNAPHSERTRSDYADPDSYWTRRSKKLRQQAATAKYSLFSSIYVYIDGSTGRICYYTLVKLIQRYGGTVLSMPSKTKCTHILAKTLNAGKVQENIKVRNTLWTTCGALEWTN